MLFYLDQFSSYLETSKRYSAHSILGYSTDVGEFFTFISNSYQISDILHIDHLMIRSWTVSLIEQGITSRSINRKISALNTFFKYLIKIGSITSNPMSKVIRPKVGKRLPIYIPDKSFLNNIGKGTHAKDLKKTTENSLYDRTLKDLIILMFYTTGMRRSELINLKINDLDRSRMVISVLGKGKKYRLIPLSKALLNEIDLYLEMKSPFQWDNPNNLLFLTSKGKPLYEKLVYNIVRATLNNIPNLERRSPHILRHTFATHLSDEGADINAIKMLLGHANLSATQVYMHNAPGRLKSIYEKAHPRAEK